VNFDAKKVVSALGSALSKDQVEVSPLVSDQGRKNLAPKIWCLHGEI
jgi:hypothetical protein